MEVYIHQLLNMKLLNPNQVFIVKEIIKYLCILLFCYASLSKILDFEQFRVQLGQSPMLSAFADYIALGIPAMEILTVIFLVVPKMELIGFYSFYSLMVMFTSYIILILNFTDFIPCSCGGVLETLGWTEHMIFNLVFILISLFAIYLNFNLAKCESKNACQ